MPGPGMTLAEALRRNGVESTEAAYEPVWDTWGFREDFTPDAVLATFAQVHPMDLLERALDGVSAGSGGVDQCAVDVEQYE